MHPGLPLPYELSLRSKMLALFFPWLLFWGGTILKCTYCREKYIQKRKHPIIREINERKLVEFCVTQSYRSYQMTRIKKNGSKKKHIEIKGCSIFWPRTYSRPSRKWRETDWTLNVDKLQEDKDKIIIILVQNYCKCTIIAT